MNVECPFCGAEHSRATGVIGEDHLIPEDGDVAFCFDCGEWAIYEFIGLGMYGRLRKPNAAEYTDIGLDKDMQKLRRLWADVKKYAHGSKRRLKS